MLACGLLLLWAAAQSNHSTNRLRSKYHLTQTVYLDNAPPEVAFTTVALGAFNGLLADFLWMRAMGLQEGGKYFEAVQLADWITKLQPRFTLVWLFQAWNMAYNISVEFPFDANRGWEDRWHWVQRGSELLREDGMKYNPNDPELYRELAWIFFDKMGGQNDDANMYYKQQWAKQMTELFDGPKPDYASLIAAPKTVEALRKDAQVAALLDSLAADGVDFAEDYLRIKDEQLDVPAAAKKKIADPANKAACDRVSLYARAATLRGKYQTDPAEMQQLDKDYGELEWRLPEAHGVYWTIKGAALDPKDTSIHSLNNDRVLLHALESNFERGHVLFMTEEGVPLTDNNPNVVPKLHEYWDKLEERYPEDKDSLEVGHLNYLRAAVRMLTLFNRTSEAQKYFDLLKKRRPRDFGAIPDIQEFTLREFSKDIAEGSGQKDTYNFIMGTLHRLYLYLAVGEADQAAGSDQFAKWVYDRYMAKWADKPSRHLPPFATMKKTMLDLCLKEFPPALRDRLQEQANMARGGGR